MSENNTQKIFKFIYSNFYKKLKIVSKCLHAQIVEIGIAK